MATEFDQKVSNLINGDVGYQQVEKKQSKPYLKGAIASLLVLGVGTALYSWGSHSEPVEMSQPNEVEYDEAGNPMYLLKEGSDEFLQLYDKVGSHSSVIPHSFWTKKTAPGKGEGWGLSQGKEMVVFKSWRNKWMSMHTGDGNSMSANRGAVGPWEKFAVEYQGGDVFAFKAWNGKYVCCNNGQNMQANRGALGPWEKFYVYTTNDKGWGVKDNGDKYVALKSVAFNKWVVAEGNDALNCNRDAPGPWEKWYGWTE